MMDVKGSTSHMPSRNVIREFAEDQYYHVYNRGVEKRVIFLDDQDYGAFLGLLKKYLSGENTNKNNRHKFALLQGQVELLAFCLMPNHFHLLFYQATPQAITQLMRRVSTGYVMYFNKRYKRSGALFQGNYKASLVNKDAYLHHISRYIHLNPADYTDWPYSSYSYYLGDKHADWVKPGRVLELFSSASEYAKFVADYTETKAELSVLKWQLANELED